MALSDYEKQVLAQMEEQLHTEDPKMADRMRETSTKVAAASSSPRRVAAGVVMVLIGVAMLIGGLIATPAFGNLGFLGTGISVLGFVVIVLGVLKIFGIGSKGNTTGSSAKPAARPAAPARAGRPGGSFMDRQNERWDRRQQGE